MLHRLSVCPFLLILLVEGTLPTARAEGPALHSAKPSVDLRPRFRELKLEVRQQGKRGSCQVFGMVTVAEYLLAKAGQPGDLSQQYLMWAANEANGIDLTEGFNPDRLITGWRKHGICTAPLMPYLPANEAIAAPSAEARKDAGARRTIQLTSIKHWDTPNGFTFDHLQRIIDQLDGDRPVSVTFCWPFGRTDDQLLDKDGLMIDQGIDGASKNGHGVAVVGYALDDQAPGGGTLLFRNSWGPRFGDGGHARVSFAFARKYGTDAYQVEVRPLTP